VTSSDTQLVTIQAAADADIALLRETYRLASLDVSAAQERKDAANAALRSALWAIADKNSLRPEKLDLRIDGQPGALRMGWQQGRRTTNYAVLSAQYPDAYSAAVKLGNGFWVLREVN
jgi:hypothetical protein